MLSVTNSIKFVANSMLSKTDRTHLLANGMLIVADAIESGSDALRSANARIVSIPDTGLYETNRRLSAANRMQFASDTSLFAMNRMLSAAERIGVIRSPIFPIDLAS